MKQLNSTPAILSYLLEVLFGLYIFVLPATDRRRSADDATLISCRHVLLAQDLTPACFLFLLQAVAIAL